MALPAAAARSGALLGATAFVSVAYAADWRSPLRFGVTLLFLLFVPGLALAEFAPLQGHLVRLVFALGTSIAIETLLAVLLIYTGLFSPARVFAAVAAVIVAAAGVASVTALRNQHAS